MSFLYLAIMNYQVTYVFSLFMLVLRDLRIGIPLIPDCLGFLQHLGPPRSHLLEELQLSRRDNVKQTFIKMKSFLSSVVGIIQILRSTYLQLVFHY